MRKNRIKSFFVTGMNQVKELHTVRFLFDQIKHVLIVDKLHVIVSDLLGLVDLFFFLEGSLIELLLQLLVRKVDAKLFETVVLLIR